MLVAVVFSLKPDAKWVLPFRKSGFERLDDVGYFHGCWFLHEILPQHEQKIAQLQRRSFDIKRERN
jgi:hypothetical protein